MSFRVEVIPEDPTQNGYILQPLVERLLEECGKPHADVRVLTNPKVSGYEHAKDLLASQILDRYKHRDLLLFLPDADGKNRTREFSDLEVLARGKGANLLCCAAIPEVEIWLLAGHVAKLSLDWKRTREHSRLKEEILAPFLAKHGDAQRAGGGRDLLIKETLGNYTGLLKRCPELEELQGRIQALLSQ